LTQIQKRLSLSNRAGGQGYDDIYKILGNYFFANKNYGKVTDLVTSEILRGAKISLFDNKFNPIRTVNTDAKETILFLWNAEKLIM
jgi:hypothetical protein